MAYCVQADIEKLIPVQELAELTTESGSTVDPDVVAQAITAADAEIDAYCGKQYEVPFTTVPDRIAALSVDIAIYHLYSRRSVAPEIRRIKYTDAIVFLKDVAKGVAVLGGTASPPAASSGDAAPDITSQTRVFDRSSLSEW